MSSADFPFGWNLTSEPICPKCANSRNIGGLKYNGPYRVFHCKQCGKVWGYKREINNAD